MDPISHLQDLHLRLGDRFIARGRTCGSGAVKSRP